MVESLYHQSADMAFGCHVCFDLVSWGGGPLTPFVPSPPLESLDNTFRQNTTCNLQCHGQNMKQSKLDIYICLVGWQTSLHWAYVSLRLCVQNGISRLISALCVNCLISILEYSRIRLRVQNGISCLISALCVNCLISIPEYSRLNHLDVHLV